ncbi:hypothetical protein BV183_00520 [Haemophilus influenzae]|nr:hypothetical protein BV181_01481 [Haemophilus influenzae]PRK47384.1 hypothetical protein BV183_00520 [Haemophilus influenzae]PRK49572.1 hypothetical protein BV182_00835 [Haemophilus influenzae]
MIFNPFIVFKSPVIFTLLEAVAITRPEPLALVAFTTVWLPDAAPFNLASFALIAKVPLAALMLESAAVVKVPFVAVKVAAPLVASIFAAPSTVKLPVFAITFTALPEIVPPIVPVALVILASPDFASIFEPD